MSINGYHGIAGQARNDRDFLGNLGRKVDILTDHLIRLKII
jgi:hypothetical protein